MRFSDKSILYVASSMMGSVLQLVLGIVLVRYLSQYDYGTYRQILLITALASSGIALGLPQSLSFFIPRAGSPSEKKHLAFQVFTLLILVGSCVAIIMYMFRGEVSSGMNNPELVKFSWIFSLFFVLLVPSKCAQSALVALGRINFASILNLATSMAHFLFVLVPLLMGQDLRVILLSLLTVYGLQFVVVLSVLGSLEGGVPKPLSWTSLKSQISYSFPYWLSIMVGVLRSYIDQFLVAILYRPENFAIYARGAFELPLAATIPWSLGHLITPRLVEFYAKGEI
ncbi:MAG: oligosaccharide flippase family protein, partial [Nitrospirae bacterium]|nr:oligosaccharide flippase family protein [Nitrospirota bacterium]